MRAGFGLILFGAAVLAVGLRVAGQGPDLPPAVADLGRQSAMVMVLAGAGLISGGVALRACLRRLSVR